MSQEALHRRQVEARNINFLVTADYYLPHSGGSRVYYAALYRRLLAQYPDTVTLVTKKVPGWREFDRNENTASFRIHRRFRPLPNWKYGQWPRIFPQLLHAAGTALTGQYDCLHCCDLFPQGLNGVALRRVFGLPMLIYCHGDEISQIDKRRYQPRVRDFIYRQADAIVAANQFACDGLARIGIPADRVHKLTPGVDTDEFQPRPKNQELVRRYRLENAKVLLTVARLVPRKGHKVVLQSLPKVLDRIPNLKYLIVGGGPEEHSLQALVQQLRLQEAVIFVGDVAHHEVCDFYNLCDVSLMINRLESGGDVESFGMVFTEANATGKPVIGGRSGGTAEAIVEGQTGFLVDPDSHEEVAERLLLLLENDELCKRMGSAGLERVHREFNWNTRAQALRQISAELVMRKRYKMDLPAANAKASV